MDGKLLESEEIKTYSTMKQAASLSGGVDDQNDTNAQPHSESKTDPAQVDNADSKEKESESISGFVTGGSGYLGRNLIRYLVKQGWKIYSLARSSKSIAAVEQVGAVGVKGDLNNVDTVTRAMKEYKCKFCFHCAGYVQMWGVYQHALEINKVGTANVAQACQNAGIVRLIHVSTEQVLQDKELAMTNWDETREYPSKGTFGVYGATKREAEIEVLKYNNYNEKQEEQSSATSGLQVVIIRPRWIWGSDDTKVMTGIVDAIHDGTFAWFDGGMYETSTAHVLNVCYAMWMIAVFDESVNLGGKIYFVTDGNNVKFKYFIKDLLKCIKDSENYNFTKNVDQVNKVDSFSKIWCLAGCLECLFCCGESQCCNNMCCCCDCVTCCEPPVTRPILANFARECTVNDAKIRQELNYKQIISQKDGLIEFAKQNGKTDEQIANIKWESCL